MRKKTLLIQELHQPGGEGSVPEDLPDLRGKWFHPLRMGRLEDPDAHMKLTGRCGDTMEIFLKFGGDRVAEALFQTDGCGTSIMCGSVAANLAMGKDPDELLEITGEAILRAIGGLPKKDRHCAYLAAETLQSALNEYMIKRVKDEKNTSKS